MDVQDYKAYLHNFRELFPAVAEAVTGPEEAKRATRKQWFDDVFSLFGLEAALEMNRRLLATPDAVRAASAEEIPRLFVQTINRIIQENIKPIVSASKEIERDRVMRSMANYVRDRMKAMRQTGEPVTEEMISRWTKEASDRYDDASRDTRRDPVSCAHCEDTGYLGYTDHRGKHIEGCCPACQKGSSVQQTWVSRGKQLGFSWLPESNATASSRGRAS